MNGPAKRPFESELPGIRAIVRDICQRKHLNIDLREELTSDVVVKLYERWDGICADFKNGCTFKTYLHVIIDRKIQDLLDELWGRWRHSKVALALGPEARRLDILIYRDRLSSSQAVASLKRDPRVTLPEAELEKIARLLPAHHVRRDQPPASSEASSPTPDPLVTAEDRRLAQRVLDVLTDLQEALPKEDRWIVQQRFYDRKSISEVARILGVAEKPFFKRVQRILRGLRQGLQEAGIDRESVERLIGRDDFDFPDGIPAPQPSKE